MLKEIPFVKSIVGFYNIYNSVSERFKIKKTLTFFKQLLANTIDESVLQKFRDKFDSDEKFKQEVLEIVIVANERFFNIEKSKIFANFFRALILNELTYQEFKQLSSILDSVQFHAIEALQQWYLISPQFNESIEARTYYIGPLLLAIGITLGGNPHHRVSPIGAKFYHIGVAPIYVHIHT